MTTEYKFSLYDKVVVNLRRRKVPATIVGRYRHFALGEMYDVQYESGGVRHGVYADDIEKGE